MFTKTLSATQRNVAQASKRFQACCSAGFQTCKRAPGIGRIVDSPSVGIRRPTFATRSWPSIGTRVGSGPFTEVDCNDDYDLTESRLLQPAVARVLEPRITYYILVWVVGPEPPDPSLGT